MNRIQLIIFLLLAGVWSVQADPVAKIESTEYATLADAVNDVPAGTKTTIMLLADVTLDSYLEIPGNKEIVLDLQSHTVQRSLSAATSNGYVIKVASGGTLTIQGAGTITGGWNKSNGGGIYNQGTLLLSNVTISGNKTTFSTGSAQGAGIYMAGGTVTIDNCEIESNISDGNAKSTQGAGIYVAGGTLSVTGSTISNNSSGNAGGGIFVNAGTVTVTNTIISGNSAYANATGAGVYLNNGTLTIDGGAITGNICTKDQNKGTGLYYNGGTLNMKGSTTISGNYKQGNTSNIANTYLPTGKKITVVGDLTGSQIGVTLQTVTNVITTGLSDNGDETCFTSDNSSYVVGLNDSGEAILERPYVCQNVNTGIKYETIADAVSAANAGETIALLKDVVNGNALVISSGKDVVLDLKGHTLSRSLTQATNNGHVISVKSGATLTVQDTSDGVSGTITGGWTTDNGGGIYNDGTFILKSGTITGNKATNSGKYGGGIYSSGVSTLIIEGGEVIYNEAATKGGGIHISSRQVNTVANCVIKGNKTTTTTNGWGAGLYIQRGTVTVTGCTITENDGQNQGAGVFMGADTDNPVVTINNTTISDNTSTSDGAGLYFNRGTLQMEGAVTVSGNTTNGETNNVYLPSGKTITVTSDLTGSEIGVTLQTVTDVFTSGLSGNGDDTCFTSDDTDYVVGLNSSHEAILGTPITVTFDANGGTGTMDAFTFAKGSSSELPSCTFTPPSQDEIFSGWTTNADGTGTKYADEDDTRDITEDVTLYAQWKVPVYVCKIKGTDVVYESVAAAAKAAAAATTEDDRTIVLLQDFEEEASTKTDYILDLNGYTLTGKITIKDGDVVITDNSASGTGTITGTEYVVYNQGTLTVNKGSFLANNTLAVYNTGTLTVNDGMFDAANRVIENDGGTCTINGGSITGNTFCLSNTNDGDATINGGSITASSGYAIVNQGHTKHHDTNICHLGHLCISGGTFSGVLSDIYSTDTVKIKGGTFNSLVSHANANNKSCVHGLLYQVDGGKYRVYDYNIHCGIIDPDKTLSSTPINGYYEIVYREPMCEINGTQYRSLDSAFKEAQQGDVITLLRDVDDGHGIRLADASEDQAVVVNDITIDFNGHTYEAATRAVGSGIKGKGKVWTQVLHYGSLHSLTMKNGTIKVTDGQDDYFPMFMQNYCDLILEGMTLDATNVDNEGTHCLNFRNGASVIRGTTTIKLPDVNAGNFAMSLNMGSDSNYPKGASLEIDGNEVEILGNFTVLAGSGVDAGLSINGGHFSDFFIQEGADKDKIHISGGTYDVNDTFITDACAINAYCDPGYFSCDYDEDEDTWTVRYPLYDSTYTTFGGTIPTDSEGTPAQGAPYDRTEDRDVTSAYYVHTYSPKATNHYQCWLVPFDYKISEKMTGKFTFYSIDTAEQGSDEKTYIYVNEMSAGDVLTHNIPYVIKPKEAGTFGFASEYDEDLYAKDESSLLHLSADGVNFDFYAVYEQTYADEEREWLTLSVYGNTFWAVPGDDVKAYRWIVKATDGSGNIPANLSVLWAEGPSSTTAIDSLENLDNTHVVEIEGYYSLDGVRLDAPQKGINIVRLKDNTTRKIIVK